MPRTAEAPCCLGGIAPVKHDGGGALVSNLPVVAPFPSALLRSRGLRLDEHL